MSLLLLLLAAGDGVLLLGLVRAQLRLEERLAAAVVAATVVVSSVCFLLSLVIGFNPLSILGATLVVAGVAGLFCWRTGGLTGPWRASWDDALRRHQAGRLRGLVVILLVLGAGAAALFGRVLSIDKGAVVTGYWVPDWAQHLITASAFSVAHTIPPDNPIFSGTPLYYPFLPDFSSAMLMRLGMDAGPALELPQAALCVVIGLLIISLAERLGARRAVGVIAVAICFLGGGLGFLGAFGDACARSGYSDQQCSVGYALAHPLEGPGLAATSLHGLPAIVAGQPRQYDGLPSLQPQNVTPVYSNQQWYTPLFGWWLPQRSMVYGFATVLTVLTILLAALADPARRISDLILAGGLAGLLPLIHVHSLIALGIIAAGLALTRWRRAWLGFAAATAVVAAPRLLQLAASPHGTASLGNQYPWLEPGWLAQPLETTSVPHSPTLASLPTVLGETLALPFSGRFWGFWLINLGIAVPLCLVVVLAAVARRLPQHEHEVERVTAARSTSSAVHGAVVMGHVAARVRTAAEAVGAAVPAPLLRFCLCCMPIFAIANLVVFQSWDWDNTKLFAYWYLGAALLIASLAVHWWRGTWRSVLAVLMIGSVLATGTLAVLRLLPFHAACSATVSSGCYASSITGPDTLVSAADRRMADVVTGVTAANAVFLTSPRFDDPIPMLTGRSVVMGYEGWVWSYGIDYRQRRDDIATAFAGCGSTSLRTCSQTLDILHRYRVSYVEVDESPPPQSKADPAWWAAQGLPVVARSDHIVIYDVRRP